MIAATVEGVVAGEVIIFTFNELFGAVRLVKPNNANSIGAVADDTFGDSEVAAGGAGSFEVRNPATNDDFARLNIGKTRGGGEVFVSAREIIKEVADGLKASFI